MSYQLRAVFVLAVSLLVSARQPLAGQNYEPSPDLEAIHVPFDAILDVSVRDGLVYYRALQTERAKLNRYLGLLATTTAKDYDSWNNARQMAF